MRTQTFLMHFHDSDFSLSLLRRVRQYKYRSGSCSGSKLSAASSTRCNCHPGSGASFVGNARMHSKLDLFDRRKQSSLRTEVCVCNDAMDADGVRLWRMPGKMLLVDLEV